MPPLLNFKAVADEPSTRDHSTFNWVYRFLVMGRIFKAALLRFNVISGIEDFINVLNDLKNYP